MSNWYDNFVNQFNFIRWADGEGRLLSEIQVPELYCLGVQSTAVTNNTTPDIFVNKNNFFRWVDVGGISLSELSGYFCGGENDLSGAYSDGYSDGYS